MVDVVDFKTGVEGLYIFCVSLFALNFRFNIEEAFCSGFHCTEIDIRSDETATKFHSDGLCGAAAHEAVEDDDLRDWMRL